jgi:hypothetical protein
MSASLLLLSAFVTVPYGSLMSCGYYRHGCGFPSGLAVSAALSLPHDLEVELNLSTDVLLNARPEAAVVPTLGLWWRFDLDTRWAIYPRVDLGISWFPKGFEPIVPYYDVGGGALFSLSEEWKLRGELSFRGARVGMTYQW